MLIHDDIYEWQGWGGKMKLGSGKCRLRIYDLKKDAQKGLAHLKPIIVIISDVPESRMSVKSCTGHIATYVTKDFKIDPQRMLWLEYYPEKQYGVGGTHRIPEAYELVEFVWHEDKAIQPKWKHLSPTLLDMVKKMVQET
ncbi:MAG TPA: hypothetical protein DCQ37_13090 [Desulfobacteraceae bacterium]|nr:hypothetical protein [Desulfobacteraceae bacterium]